MNLSRGVMAGAVAAAAVAAVVAGSARGDLVPSRVRRGAPPITKASPGLVMRLSDAKEAVSLASAAPPAAAIVLTDDEVARLLARVPPLAAQPGDAQPFALREGSLPPPRSGAVVKTAFPPAGAVDGGPPSAETGPLVVARRAPEGDVPNAVHVSVTFSLPMVAVTSHDELAAEARPVRIFPERQGRWRWVGTRTLLFEPAGGRLPMATEYTVTVPADVRAASGGALAAADTWRFRTPPPRLTASHPVGGPARRDALLFAGFDQRVDPRAVLAQLRVRAGRQDHAVRLATAEEVAADEAVAALSRRQGEGTWLAFRTVEPLPADAAISVALEAGTPSAEGPLVTTAAQQWAFRTFGPLRVKSQRCGWDDQCPPGTPFVVELTNPIDVKAFGKDMVTVEPAVPGLRVTAGSEHLNVQGATRAGQRYRVTLDPSISDVFGQTLGAAAALSFTVGPAFPAVFAPGGDLVVLDPAGGPRLSVYSTGTRALTVSVYRVTPEDWTAYRAFVMRAGRDRSTPVAPGTRVAQKTIPVSVLDERVETVVDVTPALANGLGHAIVVVDAEAPASARRWQGRVIKWVQSTLIGLDAFADGRRLAAWATSLSDGRPLEGAEVALGAQGPWVRTGPDGLAMLDVPTAPAPVMHVKSGGDVTFLPHQASWWSESGWQQASQKPTLRWQVFDDRGLYRPGDEVRVKGWIRAIAPGPTGDIGLATDAVRRVAWALRDAQGNEVGKGEAEVGALGGFDFALTLPATMNLGHAYLTLTAAAPGYDGTEHGHALQIQEFRRPEFEVSAQASEGPHVVGGSAVVTASAKYFAGGGLPDTPLTWRVTTTPGAFIPPGRDDYTFGTWVAWWRPWPTPAAEHTLTYEGRTDAAGEHRLRIELVSMDPPRPTHVSAEATVTDVNRQAWSAAASLLVHPARVYVGLRSERQFVQRGEALPVRAIVVDLDGKAVAGREVVVRLDQLGWEQVAGEWKEVAKTVDECRAVSTADAHTCTFRPAEGGSYRMVASVRDAEGRANETQLQIWVAGGTQPPRREVDQEEVTLVPSRKDLAPGDTAEILVVAPFANAEGLLSLRRSGLVRTERFRIQGTSHTLRIPIEDTYVPNVHVQVDLVGAAARTTDTGDADPRLPSRPAFAKGTLDLAVPPVRRALTVRATPAQAATQPGAKTEITVEVKDASGRPVAGAEVALVAADEAVLALTGYRIADPLEVFYARRSPDVSDHHLRAHVMLGRPEDVKGVTEELAVAQYAAVGAADMAMALPPVPMARAAMSKGRLAGLAEGQAEPSPAIALRTDFRALALFAPAVRTDAAGRAVVPVNLPESLTRYRITAVAVAGGRQFGKGESTVTARLPLMVRPSAPRFLNFGDRFELPVVLQNQTDAPLAVEVAVRASNATLDQGAGRRITVPANDRVEVRFPASAARAGTARFQVVAASGRWSDAADVSLPVWTPATTEAFATYGEIDQGAIRQPVRAPEGVVPDFGGVEVTTSSTALQALTDAVLYLTAYPFECSEQIASRVLAIAALKDVLAAFEAKGLPPPAELTAAVDRDLALLARLQNGDGGFAFWRRGDPSWPYVSIHVAHAFHRAKVKGFAVPAEAYERSQQYLRTIESHIPAEYGPDLRRTLVAYALDVRHRMKETDGRRARTLVAEAGVEKLSFEALGWVLPVLAADGATAEVAAIRRHLGNRVAETAAAAHFQVSYGDRGYLLLHSDRRADAVILDALIATEPRNDLIPKLVSGLLGHRRAGRWENTQENAFVLLAIGRYFAAYEGVTPQFVARVWLGERYAGEHAFRGRTTERHHVDIPMRAVAAAKTPEDVVVAKDGPGRLYYRIGMRYAPASLRLAAADHGFTVERRYEGADDPKDVRRDPDGTWRVRAGARVRVRLTLATSGRRTHVALVDPLPAGLEALNPALPTTGALPPVPGDDVTVTPAASRGWLWWWRPWFEHQNLRDERVEAFTSLLWEGVHRYDYVARATTPGHFVVPPAKAEEMYHPETFGRTATDRVVVE